MPLIRLSSRLISPLASHLLLSSRRSFNFHKAYHILDELLITGELQEPSKKAILRVTAAQDALMEGSGDSKVSDSKYEI